MSNNMAHINIMSRQPISFRQAMSLSNNPKKTSTVNGSFMCRACFSKQLKRKQVQAKQYDLRLCD